MKYIKQAAIIFLISLIGEVLKKLIPLPVPASIYGMVIMFVCLCTGIIKLSDVKETGKFLVEIMTVLFIPAGVGLMASFGILKPYILPACLILVASSLVTMFAAGRASQSIIRHGNKKGDM